MQNLKFIGYKELGNKEEPEIKDFLMKEKYEGQDIIVNYLKNLRINKDICVSTAVPKDIFTGETIKTEDICISDGIYAWSITLSYYVKKYNLRLPKDFEEHILNRFHEVFTKKIQ